MSGVDCSFEHVIDIAVEADQPWRRLKPTTMTTGGGKSQIRVILKAKVVARCTKYVRPDLDTLPRCFWSAYRAEQFPCGLYPNYKDPLGSGQGVSIHSCPLFHSFSSLLPLFFLSLSMITVARFAVGLLFISSARAFFRLTCNKPVLDTRADPIVNPNQPSIHMHTIHGSGGMGAPFCWGNASVKVNLTGHISL